MHTPPCPRRSIATHPSSPRAAAVLLGLLFACLSLACSGPSGQPDAGSADAGAEPGRDGGVEALVCPPPPLPASLDGARWDARFTLAGLTGRDGVTPIVRDVAAAPDGSAVVVGYFRWAGRTRLDQGVVRVRARRFEPLAERAALPAHPEGYAAVAVDAAGRIALAEFRVDAGREGRLLLVSGGEVREIARFTGNVRTLAFVGDALWVAGQFAVADGPRHLAVWDGTELRGAPGGDPDAAVLTVTALSDGSVAVGGSFGRIGGIDAGRVAVWDGVAWSPRSFAATEALRVLRLVEWDGELVAGGVFALAGATSSSLARFRAGRWESLGGGVSVGPKTGVIADLRVDGERLVAFGCFDRAGGEAGADVPGLAAFDGAGWSALGPSGAVGSHWYAEAICGDELDDVVVWLAAQQRLGGAGDDILLAGAFGGFGGVVSQSLIAVSGGAFHPLGEPGDGVAGALADVTVGGASCDPIALVSATHVGGRPLEGAVVRFDGASVRPVGGPLPAESGACTQIAATREHVYVGCTTVSNTTGEQRGRLLRATSTGWDVVGGTLPGSVARLVVAPDAAVWLAGMGDTGWIGRVSGDAVEVIEDRFDGPVLEVAFGPRRENGTFEMVVGGAFTALDGAPLRRVARREGERFEPVGEGLASACSALAVGADGIYAGTFDEGTSGRIVLGRFDGTAWRELATPERGLGPFLAETSPTFTTLSVHGDAILATGYVWPAAGGRNAYVLRGDRFTALAGGVQAITVDGAAVTADAIWLAGTIAEVGDDATLAPSVGIARLDLAP